MTILDRVESSHSHGVSRKVSTYVVGAGSDSEEPCGAVPVCLATASPIHIN